MSEQEAEAVIEIQGMSCGACVEAVESALQLPGVRACAVVLGRATVSFDNAQLTAAQLLEGACSPLPPAARSRAARSR